MQTEGISRNFMSLRSEALNERLLQDAREDRYVTGSQEEYFNPQVQTSGINVSGNEIDQEVKEMEQMEEKKRLEKLSLLTNSNTGARITLSPSEKISRRRGKIEHLTNIKNQAENKGRCLTAVRYISNTTFGLFSLGVLSYETFDFISSNTLENIDPTSLIIGIVGASVGVGVGRFINKVCSRAEMRQYELAERASVAINNATVQTD